MAKKAVLFSVNDLDTILYRQNILRDCLNNPSIVRDIYAIAVESIEKEKKHYFGFLSNYPDTILNRSIEVLQMFVVMLKKLTNIGDEHAGKFESEGFRAFFAMLNKELSDEYFASIQNHLRRVKFRGGVLMSAELGKGGRGANYILRKPQDRKQSWIRWLLEQLPVQRWMQWLFELFEGRPAVYTLYVPAESFCSNVCYGLFTHYKREEDAAMKSGKFDEELSRMSDIVDNVTPNSILLFNESFAATNEREGAEIARQIISALLEKQIKVFFVTHSYECAHSFYDKEMENAIFLRAERQPDGVRTFKLLEGEPLQTSYGQDLYNKIFTSGTDLSRQLSPKLL